MLKSHEAQQGKSKTQYFVRTWISALTLMAFSDVWADELAPIVITGNYDNSIGSSDAASQGVITSKILESRPLLRPGDMLEYVPGMAVTQHSGDGKANQYFLRGFNLDHGTDFATSINGMPINMPTSAHGQGYTDLNFLIPELVQQVNYRKGPYFAQDGDFSSAGAADFFYKTKLDQNFAQYTLGQRGYGRFVSGISNGLSNGMNYVAAAELMQNNGPWTTPENLKRANGVLMLSDGTKANGWTASLMSYSARWTATDQVPLSLIESGQLGRFDSLDPTDGGQTHRTSASVDWRQSHGNVVDKVMAYAINYDLTLFSNFSYYTNDNAAGDQFIQKEKRNVYGLKASRQWVIESDVEWVNTLGLQSRSDVIDVGLGNTQARVVSSWTRQDKVRQNLTGIFGDAQARWTPWMRTNFGIRLDQYNAHVANALSPAESGSSSAYQWSPKFSLVLGPWANTEYFFNAGKGFHSNDARGTTALVDRAPGLVASKGYEFGVKTQAIKGLQSSLTLWRLNSDSELVYVGDIGGTEIGRASTRVGVEWNNRWLPNKHLEIDADLAWTKPRYVTDDGSGRYIPNTVEKVAVAAVTVKDIHQWNFTAQLRYIGPAALTEDNSVRSSPSSIMNIKLRRKLDQQDEVYIDVFNVFNQKFNDIAYFAANLRPYQNNALLLAGNQVQVHPGEPRSVRLTYIYRF